MIKNKSKFYFTTILFIHILVYFIKIDRDVFAFQEYISHPHQSYNEQPLSKNIAYFNEGIPNVSRLSESSSAWSVCNEETRVWNIILLSYNTRVRFLLKQIIVFDFPGLRTAIAMHKQNISCESSDDEEPGS